MNVSKGSNYEIYETYSDNSRYCEKRLISDWSDLSHLPRQNLAMIIVPYRYGQLGNQLFHIAHLYAAHKVTGQRVVFCSFGYSKKCFPQIDSNPNFRVMASGNLLNRLLRKSTVLHRKLFNRLTSGVISHLYCETPPYIDSSGELFSNACKKRIFICEGWGFRDNTSVQTFRQDIVKFLALSEDISRESVRFLESVRTSSKCCLVGFHVRRGDYQKYKNGLYFLSDAQWRAVIHAAKRIVESTGRTFCPIIFSNENCEAFKDVHNVTFASGDIYTDLRSLASCDLIVAPPSTFSGWASYLGNVDFAEVDINGNYESAIANAAPIRW